IIVIECSFGKTVTGDVKTLGKCRMPYKTLLHKAHQKWGATEMSLLVEGLYK
ncbi:16222_t:CDS:2, partial [Funneliformis caledonium]